MKIEFESLNIDNFMDFLKKADIGESGAIDFAPHRTESRMSPVSKTHTKYTGVDTPDIINFKTKNVPLFKLFLTKFKKMKDVLAIYKKIGVNKLSGYFNLSDDNGNMVVSYMSVVGEKTKMKITGNDPKFIKYMPSAVWDKLSDTSKSIVEFEVTQDLANHISDLASFRQDDAIDNFLNLSFKNNSVTITDLQGNWEVCIDQSNSNVRMDDGVNLRIMVNKYAIDGMCAAINSVYISKSQDELYAVYVKSDDNNMIIATGSVYK